jgi:hypothetical protein
MGKNARARNVIELQELYPVPFYYADAIILHFTT